MFRSRVIGVLAALTLVISAVPMMTQVANAATRDATAYVSLSSTRPGPGCNVALSVEVRASGAAVTNTEVSIALFVGETLMASDSENTNGDGIAHVTVNTAGVGADGWLDLNIGGSYLKGYSVGVTDGNSCEASSVYEVIEGGIGHEAAASGSSLPSFYTYQQQRNLSCEFAAVHIATAFYGYGISEYDLDAPVGRANNPHKGYRGDINGSWGNTKDYGVYAAPLADALPQFGFYGSAFYGSGSSAELTSNLDAGAPVIVWLALWGDLSDVLYDSVGDRYTVTAGMHVMVAYAYDESNVYLSDPGSGSLVAYSWGSFMEKWNVLDGMSLAVYPA